MSLSVWTSNVFLGLANTKLNKDEDAEKAYLTAVKIKPDDRTAWQGLISLYEKQGSQKVEAYRDAVLGLGQIFENRYDDNSCGKYHYVTIAHTSWYMK